MRTIRSAVWVLLAGSIGPGCSGGKYKVDIDFEYKSLAVGNEGTLETVVLEKDEEQMAVSTALVKAIQNMQHNIVDPKLKAGESIASKKPVRTNFMELRPSDIDLYNSKASQYLLSKDALYRVSYTFEYSIVDKQIHLLITPGMERRGAGGEWYEFDRYLGSHFVSLFRSKVLEALPKKGGPP